MEVRDAETSELIRVECVPSTPSGHKKLPTVLPSIASPSKPASDVQANDQKQSLSPSVRTKFPETQSYRSMGAGVNWSKGQREQEERAESRFLSSIQGLRSQLHRKDLNRDVRQAVEIQILERMKAQYAEQVQRMVLAEMNREVAREVELRLELSAIGKERIRKKHDRDRAFHKSQIDRIRTECEMSLVATMAQYNLLR